MAKGKVVILTEKPKMTKVFSSALGGKTGTYKGENYEIVNAAGHLFQYPNSPEKMVKADKKDKYKSWNIENLPWDENDFNWKKVRTPMASKFMPDIEKAVKDATEIAIATDIDSSGEGDLIAWEIIDDLKFKGKITRLEFVDDTLPTLRDAFESRRLVKSRDTEGALAKAEARSKFDYLSMQFTRLSTGIAGQTLNYTFHPVIREGRLKSFIKSRIGEQEDLVNAYVKVNFYTVRFKDENGHEFKRSDKNEDRKPTKEEVSLEPWENSPVVVKEETKKRSAPPKLIDLMGIVAALPQYSPATVQATYQRLYLPEDYDDGRGYVSYPRTDDKTITFGQFDELLPLVDSIARVVGVDSKILTRRKPRTTHVVKEGNHGANRPGLLVPKSLKSLEKYGAAAPAIYELVAKNYLAMLAEDYEYLYQEGYLEKYPEFKGSARVPISLGFKEVIDTEKTLEEAQSEENNLPLGKDGKAFVYEGSNPKPQSPSVSWIRREMEKYNIGTGATRSSTISEITKPGKTQIAKLSRGKLSLTEVGRRGYLLSRGTNISSPEVTEKLYEAMEDLGSFKGNKEDLFKEMNIMLEEDTAKMRENAPVLKEERDEKVSEYKKEEDKKIEVELNGEMIKFKREWGGQEFDDEDLARLIEGKEIIIERINKKGDPYRCRGRLEKQEYKGHTFWGFKALEFLKAKN